MAAPRAGQWVATWVWASVARSASPRLAAAISWESSSVGWRGGDWVASRADELVATKVGESAGATAVKLVDLTAYRMAATSAGCLAELSVPLMADLSAFLKVGYLAEPLELWKELVWVA